MTRLVKKCSAFKEPHRSLTCSQRLTTGPYPETLSFSFQRHTVLKVRCNVILPFTPRFPKWCPPLSFLCQHSVCVCLFLRDCFTNCLPWPPWFFDSNDLKCRGQILKLFIMKPLPSSYFFPFLSSKYWYFGILVFSFTVLGAGDLTLYLFCLCWTVADVLNS
jgi:hypothetical protein